MSSFSQNDFDTGDAGQAPLDAQFASQGDGLDTLGGGGAPADDTRKRMMANTFLLLLVIVVAGTVLTVMRNYGKGAKPVIADVKIDYNIGNAGVDNEHIKVLENLKSADASVQIPLEAVRQNPFEIEGAQTTSARPGETEADRQRREREQRQRTIEQRFAQLRLNSVLFGSSPIARVSGETVRVGDTVGEYFTVVSINPRSVELRADQQVYILTLGDR